MHEHPAWRMAMPICRAPVMIHLLPQVLRAHVLPLTNCAFNKSGDRFITGSYDRTCKVECGTAMRRQ